MNRLLGKKALVFGADGITEGIATRYLQEGAIVTVMDEASALASSSFVDGVSPHSIKDRSSAAIAAAVNEYIEGGSLDILVLGGGDIPPEAEWKSIDNIDETDFVSSVETGAGAALAAVQAAGPALKVNGGSIIFMFNPAGLYSEGGWGEIPTLHHAKRGLARTLAAEWGQHQIRVNSLVPFANTSGFQAYQARNPDLIDWRVSKTAMGRVGDLVRDIGGAAVFLASEDTRFLTGSVIFADGGAFLTTPVVETSVPHAG